MQKQNWFWACARADRPGQRLVWNRKPLNMLNLGAQVVPSYLINQNAFVRGAAQIPVFSQFLRDAPSDLSNYVSNPVLRIQAVAKEPYNGAAPSPSTPYAPA